LIPPSSSRNVRPSISCVLPCWNESKNLLLLLPILQSTLSELASEFEVLLVNDGSTDDTVVALQPWLNKPGFKLIDLSRNFGKEAALTAGLQYAHGEVVICMDADMQHPPELLHKFLEQWRHGADVVYALREDRKAESASKRLGTKLFYSLVNAADRFDVPSGAGDFRLMDRAAVNALLALPERNRFMKGLYAWVGFNAIAIPYVPRERSHGETSFGLLQLLRLSLDGLTAFTTWPLRAVSTAGFILAFLGFVYGAFITIEYLILGNAVSGWTTIVVSLLLFFGIQMISIGILGEYIGRIFEEVKQRPLFIVKRVQGQGLKSSSNE
jgi:polyisoprenyl-phosphate glycosyltransferase